MAIERRRIQIGVAPDGSGNTRTSLVCGSTRTIAFWPPSVTHGAPSGPTITPCGAERGAERNLADLAVLGSSQPR